MEIKPLLCYLQAADYPEILKELEKIPCDKLILKYMPYPNPHNIARDFFLEHEEYTHLIIHPQDLIVTKRHYENIVADLQKFDYPVLAGVCNVDNNKLKHHWNFCVKLPAWHIHDRYYNWCPMGEGLGILKVKFQGFAFCFIKRNVIERKTIEGDFIFRGAIHTEGKPAPDLTFCTNCDNYNIPLYVDSRIRMSHLAKHMGLLVNKRNAEIVYIKDNQKRNIGLSEIKV